MDFGIGRTGCDAAEVDSLHAECVGAAEHRADIIERPHIVEYHREGQLSGLLELVDGQPVHFQGS